MGRIFIAELKKARSLNIWWLVLAGGILPGIITWLTFYHQEKAGWFEFAGRSLLSFNVQSLLTFAAFAAYLWAREYEENTIETVLCYPFPRLHLLLVKLALLFLVVAFTIALFFFTTLIAGRGMLASGMPKELMWKLIKALVHTGILHFLLMPVYLCVAMITRISISGLIFGIINMCICMAFSHTGFLQYMPLCIPYVLGDHLLGMNSLTADNRFWVYDCIVAGSFAAAMGIAKVLADRLKR